MVHINLEGKNAIITGGGGGLGGTTAQKLAQAGANVIVGDISLDLAERVSEQVKKLGVKSKAVRIDVTKQKDAAQIVETAVKDLGGLDILVNAAGIGKVLPLAEWTEEDIGRMIDVNLKGTILVCNAAIKHMIPKKSGKIVNFSSGGAKMGIPGSVVYSSTKLGIIGLTFTLAKEVAEHNINVNAVAPGFIKTPMWKDQLNLFTNNGTEEEKAALFNDWIAALVPLKRPQLEDDVANAVLFLCSDMAQNITAQTINVDGGANVY